MACCMSLRCTVVPLHACVAVLCVLVLVSGTEACSDNRQADRRWVCCLHPGLGNLVVHRSLAFDVLSWCRAKNCWQRSANVCKERQEPTAICRVSLRHNSKGANSISTSPVDSNSLVLATSKWLCRSQRSPAQGGTSSVLPWFVRTRHWRRGPRPRRLRRLAPPGKPTSAPKKVPARRDAGSGASTWMTRSQRPNLKRSLQRLL